MRIRRLLRDLVLLLGLLVVVNVITVEAADDESELTVGNGTDHYLHIIIEGEEYLYVAPRRSVSHAEGATPSMLLEVFYAPGQGIQGSLIDTVPVPYQRSESACSCEQGELTGECTHEPAAGGSARIEITPDLLVSDG